MENSEINIGDSKVVVSRGGEGGERERLVEDGDGRWMIVWCTTRFEFGWPHTLQPSVIFI